MGLGAAGRGVAGLGTDVPDTGDAPDAPDASAPPASGDHGITFDAPTLHPDIAKALAESTYADSATAINAMAARLGQGADDDTDEVDESWDAAPVAQTAPEGSGDEFEQFWAGDGEERAFPWESEPQGAEPDAWAAGATETEDVGLTWQPTSWDTGVETAPLPQRDRVRPEGEDDHGPIGAADPEWLENLYSQFMANGEAPAGKRRGSKEANPVRIGLRRRPCDAAQDEAASSGHRRDSPPVGIPAAAAPPQRVLPGAHPPRRVLGEPRLAARLTCGPAGRGPAPATRCRSASSSFPTSTGSAV